MASAHSQRAYERNIRILLLLGHAADSLCAPRVYVSPTRWDACHGMTSRSTTSARRYSRMPDTAVIEMAAHVMSKRSALELWRITRPRTSSEPPKYSATTAPINDNVVEILRPVKKYGRAFGIRSLRSTWPSEAAEARISSTADSSTWLSPRATFTTIGKKVSRMTIAILANGFRIPNQLDMIGAAAMIGIALAPTAIGRTASRTRAQRAIANAVRTPDVTPMTRPPMASYSVFTELRWSRGSSSPKALTTADGRGRMNCWSPLTA